MKHHETYSLWLIDRVNWRKLQKSKQTDNENRACPVLLRKLARKAGGWTHAILFVPGRILDSWDIADISFKLYSR